MMIIYEAAYIYYSFSGKHKFMTAYQGFCRYTTEEKIYSASILPHNKILICENNNKIEQGSSIS